MSGHRSVRKKVAASAAGVVGAGLLAVGLVSAPGFSLFNSAASPSSPESVSTGTVAISLGSAGSSTGDALTVGASNLAPGDTVERAATLNNGGSLPLANITLTVAPSASNALVTDATDGLQFEVQSCPSAWSSTALSDGGWSYTCSGTPTTVVASEAVASISSPINLTGLNSAAPGGTDYLMATLTLPTSAPNSFQGLSNSLTYTFTGVQQPGGAA
jgi:hypothetical protein